MDRMNISQTELDLIYLIHCALHGIKPAPERVQGFDMVQLYKLAKYHSLRAMVAVALTGQLGPEMAARWKEDREKSLRKSILLDLERKEICADLERRGIWYLPLKGSVMKYLYPKVEMREMSDQDILFDAARCQEMRDYMVARGYTVEEYGKHHHDVYNREPVFCFEMHRTLFENHVEVRWIDYYEKIKQKLIPDGPDSCGHHFTDEDFYIYMAVHSAKHYETLGTGLRSIVDIYVYNRKKESTMDWDYIRRECDYLKVAEFEQTSRSLAKKLFDSDRQPKLTVQEREMLAFCLGAGTYGTEQGRIRRGLKNAGRGERITLGTKLRYLFRRMFPSLEEMKQKSKTVRRYPWTLPVMWICRLVGGVFTKRKKVKNELRVIMDTDKA